MGMILKYWIPSNGSFEKNVFTHPLQTQVRRLGQGDTSDGMLTIPKGIQSSIVSSLHRLNWV